jgi:hypothetical protein
MAAEFSLALSPVGRYLTGNDRRRHALTRR